jgi:ribosomal protein S21
MINVEITKNPNESALNILRRFTKRVQGSGILPRVRSIRYSDRVQSHYKVKMRTLKTLRRRAEVAEQIKLGKMTEKTGRYGSR